MPPAANCVSITSQPMEMDIGDLDAGHADAHHAKVRQGVEQAEGLDGPMMMPPAQPNFS